MIAVVHIQQDGSEDASEFEHRAQAALRVLATRPGFVRGTLGRATDDEVDWLVLTEWDSVGAYRRALGAYEVKLVATPVLAQAEDRPSAFEALLTIRADGSEKTAVSDRANDADWVGRSRET